MAAVGREGPRSAAAASGCSGVKHRPQGRLTIDQSLVNHQARLTGKRVPHTGQARAGRLGESQDASSLVPWQNSTWAGGGGKPDSPVGLHQDPWNEQQGKKPLAWVGRQRDKRAVQERGLGREATASFRGGSAAERCPQRLTLFRLLERAARATGPPSQEERHRSRRGRIKPWSSGLNHSPGSHL